MREPNIELCFHFSYFDIKIVVIISSFIMGKEFPKNLMGSFGHSNSKGLVLFLLEVPIHKALVFFWFNCKPDHTPNEFTMLIAFLSDLVSSRMSVVSSANCEILAFCPFGSSNSTANLILAYFKGHHFNR